MSILVNEIPAIPSQLLDEKEYVMIFNPRPFNADFLLLTGDIDVSYNGDNVVFQFHDVFCLGNKKGWSENIVDNYFGENIGTYTLLSDSNIVASSFDIYNSKGQIISTAEPIETFKGRYGETISFVGNSSTSGVFLSVLHQTRILIPLGFAVTVLFIGFRKCYELLRSNTKGA